MRFQYINKQVIAGFVGKDIELRYMPSGDAVLDVSVATTNSWKDKQGEWHDDTEWHSCIFYRKQAEEAAAALSKGAAMGISFRFTPKIKDFEFATLSLIFYFSKFKRGTTERTTIITPQRESTIRNIVSTS